MNGLEFFIIFLLFLLGLMLLFVAAFASSKPKKEPFAESPVTPVTSTITIEVEVEEGFQMVVVVAGGDHDVESLKNKIICEMRGEKYMEISNAITSCELKPELAKALEPVVIIDVKFDLLGYQMMKHRGRAQYIRKLAEEGCIIIG